MIYSSERNQANGNRSNESIDSDISIDFENAQLVDGKQNPINSQNIIEHVDIEEELNLFDPEPISPNTSILDYWISQKSQHAHLFKLATCIYAIPPTEVEIERDFSKLNFVFTQRRHSLSEKNLKAIMRIHLNKDLFFLIKEEELQKVKP